MVPSRFALFELMEIDGLLFNWCQIMTVLARAWQKITDAPQLYLPELKVTLVNYPWLAHWGRICNDSPLGNMMLTAV